MRYKHLFLILILFRSGFVLGQDVVYAEYFVNTDPGFENGTSIPITPAPDINDISFDLDLAALNNGFHHLYVRVKDDNGKWSLTNVNPFYKETVNTTLPNIVQAEYFINTDPGLGNGEQIPVSPGQNVTNISFTKDLSQLNNGFHHLYVRVKDVNGKWSLTNVNPFYKETVNTTLPNIVQAEYFINTDPGLGNGEQISVSSGQNVTNISFTKDLSQLNNGFHHLYVRVKDVNGKWSLTNVNPFYKETVNTTLPNIVQAEYFINTDPGLGNGEQVSVIPGQNVPNISFTKDLSQLNNGFHHLYVRVKDVNGKWSLTNVNPFFKETIHATLPNIVQAEYFINTDPGFGMGNSVEVISGPDVTLNFACDISELTSGTHRIFFRVMEENGLWSLTNIYEMIVLDITVFLEGPFADGTMNSNLGSNIPLEQPFNPGLPYWGNPNPLWFYEGDEAVEETPPNLVDWILLELRETSGAAATATSDKTFWQSPAFLFADGSVKSIDAETPVKLIHQSKHDVYLVLHHRNHLSIMSAVPINKETGLYDFTSAIENAFMGGQKHLGNGIYGMYGGDGDGNGQIQTQDKNEVWNLQSGQSGYMPGDFDLNGQVQTQDKNEIWNPNSGVASQVP